MYPPRQRCDRVPNRQSLGLLLALCAALLGAPAAVRADDDDDKKDGEEQVDYLGLAARLIKDGHYDRAEITLREIDENQEGLDRMRLFTLRGIVYLKKQVYAEARDNFQKAAHAGKVEPVVFLYLAQAHFGLKEYAHVLRALDKAGAAATDLPGSYMMRAQCHWELKQPGKAIAALAQGARRFPNEPDFTRRQFFYLVDLGLFQEALELGQRFLQRKNVTEDDYVAVGEALRQAREFEQAQLILEAARLRFPGNAKLTLQLAHTYLAAEDLLSAAMLFEQASYLDSEHTLEAAELYRRARRFDRALLTNARVLDQAEKMKQRLAILLQMERFEMAAAMQPALSRLGLLAEDDIRYGLAYAYFKTGDFDAAEVQLKRIRGTEYFTSANDLRKAMQTCKEAGWECM